MSKVIFTSSGIQTLWANKNTSTPTSRFTDDHGRSTNVYSTGSLERALAEGHEIYVVSTRENLGEHDEWWITLLGGQDRVFLMPEEEFDPNDEGDREERRQKRYFLPYRALFAKVEIPFPEGSYSHWFVLLENIEQYGFVRGHHFNPE